MKPSERDNLLIRLDERSNNIWKTIEKMEVHLVTLNNSVGENKLGWKINRRWLGIITTGLTAAVLKMVGIM